MEKLNILPPDRQYETITKVQFGGLVETLSTIHQKECNPLVYMQGRKEEFINDISAMVTMFAQVLGAKADVYAQGVIERGIYLSYDIAANIHPGKPVSASEVFAELQQGATVNDAREAMTRGAQEYLQHRPSVEALVDYFILIIDPQGDYSEEIQSVIAYLLNNLEAFECDNYITEWFENFQDEFNEYLDEPQD